MTAMRVMLLGLGAATLAGCSTDLRTRPLEDYKPGSGLQAGFAYNLPAAVVTPSAAIRVAGCTVDEDAKKAIDAVSGQSDAPAPIKGATFAVAGDISVDQVAGPTILIDYRELGDFLKTTGAGLERHPNGMLKSVNVTVEDESPALIANVATIAADIALFTVSPPAAAAVGSVGAALKAQGAQPQTLGPPPTETVTYLACAPATAKAVAARNAARDAKDKATTDLEEVTAALAALMRNADTGFTQTELASIHGYRDKILALTAAINEATATIAAADAKLSLKLDVVDDIRTADDIKANGLPVDDIVAKKVSLSVSDARVAAFVRRHFVLPTAKVPDGVRSVFMSRECTRDSVPTCQSVDAAISVATKLSTARLEARPAPIPRDGRTPSFDGAPPGQKKRTGPLHPSQGIIYVEPAKYTFSLVQATFPADDLNPVTTLKSVTASVPQLGTYLILPVHAGFGEKVELKATFNTDGSLATGSYGRPSSAGKALSGSLAGVADKLLATKDAIAARKLALLKAEADRLTADKAVIDANDKLNPKADPLADINAQIAVANANATLAEANVRIMVANAKLNGGP